MLFLPVHYGCVDLAPIVLSDFQLRPRMRVQEVELRFRGGSANSRSTSIPSRARIASLSCVLQCSYRSGGSRVAFSQKGCIPSGDLPLSFNADCAMLYVSLENGIVIVWRIH